MKTTFAKLSLCTAVALPLLAASLHAQTPVTFIDGGYPELCADVAKSVRSTTRVEITGSRLGSSPIEICTLAINAGDSSPEQIAASYNNRGVLLFDQQMIAEALNDFEMAIKKRDILGQAHVNRGYILVGMKRWAESIASFDNGIRLGAEEMDKAYFNRGIAQEELGRVREAYFDYQKAAELNPEWDAPRQELARFKVIKK